jgi:hypothetical protein
VRIAPAPLRRIIGDLSDERRALDALGIGSTSAKGDGKND